MAKRKSKSAPSKPPKSLHAPQVRASLNAKKPEVDVLESDPVTSAIKHPKKRAFLAAFGELGTIRYAAEAAKINRNTHQDWLKSDPEYAKAFQGAENQAIDSLEREAIRRARDGWEEPVFREHGEIGTIRRYSDTLLIFLMKGANPRKYRDNAQASVDGPTSEQSRQERMTQVLDAIRRTEGNIGLGPVGPGDALTSRWSKVNWTPKQLKAVRSPARFRVLPCGRRAGKTELAKRYVVRAAFRGSPFGVGRWGLGAPTRDQAKRIYWADLKAMIPAPLLAREPSESELTIWLVNGSEIHVVGMDKPQRVEGSPWDGFVMDEYADMKPDAWPKHVQPSLSDRMGWCWFIGVPEGRNHYYDLWTSANADETGTWSGHSWTSEEILSPEAISQAKRDLDALTYQQEYLAEFVTFHGRAYYNFDPAANSARLTYNPKAPLIFCFDFNVSPGVAAIIQEQDLGNGLDGTGIIGEVYIPTNSTTPAVCRKLTSDWGKHEGPVICYGDATGGSRGSAKVAGSDWDLIQEALRPVFADRLSFRVSKANPPERSRVNAMNTRIKTSDGRIRLKVDPSKAPNVLKDLDGVRILEGGAGEIDKGSDPKLSHLSDSVGYYIFSEFPISGARAESEPLIL